MLRHPSFSCSLCALRRGTPEQQEVLAVIEDILSAPPYHRRFSLIELAAKSGFSRSALSRHSLKCMPGQRLGWHKNRHTRKVHNRIVVLDRTSNPPSAYCYNPWSRYPEPVVPFHGPTLSTDLTIVLDEDELPERILRRAEAIRALRESTIQVQQQADETKIEPEPESETAS